jgi:hypothetical protein
METLVTKPEGGGLITTASGAAYKSQVPIDYLLYAASYKENNPNATINCLIKIRMICQFLALLLRSLTTPE